MPGPVAISAIRIENGVPVAAMAFDETQHTLGRTIVDDGVYLRRDDVVRWLEDRATAFEPHTTAYRVCAGAAADLALRGV